MDAQTVKTRRRLRIEAKRIKRAGGRPDIRKRRWWDWRHLEYQTRYVVRTAD